MRHSVGTCGESEAPTTLSPAPQWPFGGDFGDGVGPSGAHASRAGFSGPRFRRFLRRSGFRGGSVFCGGLAGVQAPWRFSTMIVVR